MKNPTRISPALAAATPSIPKNHNEWNDLLRKTIQRATQIGDRREAGLRQAMTGGKSEQILRQMGILSQVDIDRELPLPPGT